MMLELAEDEQLAFIEMQKDKALKRVKPSDKPEYIVLIGAKGAGKSTLSKRIKNAVKISPDTIIADYIEAVGVDGTKDFYDKDIGLFATRTVNAIFRAAVENGYNIVNDTGLTDNTEKLMKIMQGYGYDVKIQAIMVDDLQVQLNVVNRKLDFDEKLVKYQQGKGAYPKDDNPLSASMMLSENSSFSVVDFLRNSYLLKRDFEVYEYGKTKPDFDSKNSKISFDEYLDSFVENLPLAEKYQNKCDKLMKKARDQGNADLEMQLINFRNNNYGGR